MCVHFEGPQMCVKGTLGTRQRSRGEVEQEKPNTTTEYCTMYISKMLVLNISKWYKTKGMLVLFIGNSMLEKSAKRYLVKISTATATATSLCTYLMNNIVCLNTWHCALCATVVCLLFKREIFCGAQKVASYHVWSEMCIFHILPF